MGLRLNLACGGDIVPGYVNHDVARHRAEVDVAHDLRVLPWPWADDSAEVIRLLNVLEHLPDVVPVIDECWRILQPGGLLHLSVPHYLHETAWLDPTHRRPFHLDSFDYFDPDTPWGQKYGFYTERKWRLGFKQLMAGDVVVFMHARKGGECDPPGWVPLTWGERIYRAARDLAGLLGPADAVVLVDQDEWAVGDVFAGRVRRHYPERDGRYGGPPANDDAAIRELERLRQSGVAAIAFAWPAFWWLEYYGALNRYLRATFRCLLENDRLVVFDLSRAARAIERPAPAPPEMKDDWDRRAREDALFYIDTASRTEEAFRVRAAADAERILADVGGPLGPESSVLEIGCGVGRLLEEMAGRFREVWGVDVSGEMIRQARQRLAHRPHVRVLENSGADLAGLPGGHFDLCYSFIVFQHVPDRRVVVDYLREAYRVLKPRGLLKVQVGGVFASNPFRHYYAQRATDTWEGVRFTMSEIVGAVEDVGFRVLSAYHADETQLYLWVVARKDGPDEWESVYFAAGRALAQLAAPGSPVVVPEHGVADFLAAAGADGVHFLYPDAPADGAQAIATLERLRRQGARYLVLTRYGFWWFDYYRAFADHLRSRYPAVAETGDYVIFELG